MAYLKLDRRCLAAVVVAAVVPALFAVGAPAPVGLPPPPLTVAAWVQGAPLERFEPGKVYVVDFWATWCGPCKAAIPHLTRLAEKYRGRVAVVGVSILETQTSPEDTEYIERVRAFVRKMGDRMPYPVAVDTPDKRMQSAWFKPAGTAGIPTAYVIDGNGRVAWVGIGTPEAVDRIVGEVLAGTFDYAKEAERQRVADTEAQRRSAADIAAAKAHAAGTDLKYPGYRAAMERGDAASALACLNAAFAADPSSESQGAYQWKLMLLLQRNNTNEVNAYARSLVERRRDNDDIMSFLSACIVSTSDEPRFDVGLALESARIAAEKSKPETRWAQFTQWRLGWAYYQVGDRTNAVRCVEQARDGVRRLKGAFDFGNLEEECDEALRTMQSSRK